MKQVFLLIFTITCGFSQIIAQASLVNPSFEDDPSDATMPKGWLACNSGTTPDILPGYWGQYMEADHGDTYLGLITRSNSTSESIGQRLSTHLDPSSCYGFKIALAKAGLYAGYKKPIKLRVWLGSSKCSKDLLIYESPLVEHLDWKDYIIKFNTDEKTYKYIIFEAFHKEGSYSHMGNILLDNISTISRCGRA